MLVHLRSSKGHDITDECRFKFGQTLKHLMILAQSEGYYVAKLEVSEFGFGVRFSGFSNSL